MFEIHPLNESDEGLIARAAVRRTREANLIILWAALGGFALGGVAGLMTLTAKLEALKHTNETVLILLPAAGGFLIGFMRGLEKAFWKKVEAAQLRILNELERRTRPTPPPPA